jgi:Fic family protein
MVEVVKKIRKKEYYYYQHRIKIENKTRVITTQIGRTDLKKEILDEKRKEAFRNHFKKIWDIEMQNEEKNQKQRTFEYTQGNYFQIVFVKIMYNVIRRFLSKDELNQILKEIFTQHVSGTTHIEGNVVNYNDIKKILEQEKTPSNYAFNDVNEIHNYLLLKSFLSSKKRHKINEKLILTINSLLMNGLTMISISGKRLQIPAGKYRKENAFLRTTPFKVSPPELIQQRMKYLFNEYEEKIKRNIHPIERSSIFHQKFEEIHPFADGNGRTGREILNLMLEQDGYPPFYIKEDYEKPYYDALESGNKEDYQVLFDFIMDRMVATVLYYLSKTSMYEVITSNALQIFGNEINNLIMTIIKKYKENREWFP